MLVCISPQIYASNVSQLEILRNMSLEELMNVSIITASGHAEKLNNTPSVVQVLTRKQIQERRYRNLSDLLADLPGVDIQRNSKSSIYNNITLRGHLSNNRFLILQDGVRIESPGLGKIAVADNFPLFHARQVEVVYGPTSALYGADAFAGVINIITEDGSEVEGADISVSVGADNYRYQRAQAGMQLSETVDLVVAGHKHRSDTADLGHYYPQDFPKVDAVTFDGRTIVAAEDREDYTSPIKSHSLFAKLKVTEHFTLGINQSHFQSLSNTGDKPDAALYLNESIWQTNIQSIYGKFNFNLTDKLSGELLLDHVHDEISPHSKYVNIYVNFMDEGYQYAKSRKNSIEQKFDYLINDQQRLIFGLVYESFYAIPQIPSLEAPYNKDRPLNEQNQYYPGTQGNLPIIFRDLHYDNQAAYAQLQSEWNPQWATILGIRYDNNSRYQATWNPRIGVVYRYTPDTVFKLNYGEAFRAPSTSEAMGTFGGFTGKQNAQGEYISNFFRTPNLDLEPEKNQHLELNLTTLFSPHFSTMFSTYYDKSDNLILTQRQKPVNQFIPGAEILNSNIKGNAGEEVHYGLDVSLNYQHQFSHGIDGDFWAGYGFIQGWIRETKEGEKIQLPYIAPHKLKLGATLRYGKYFMTTKWHVLSKTYTGEEDPNDETNRLSAPGYTLLDMHFGARDVGFKNLSLHLDIYNLLDRRYYAAAGSASTTFVKMPQQPRSLVLSLGYRF